LDTTVPSGADKAEQLEDAAILSGLARVHNLEVPVEELRRIEPAEQLPYVLERARQMNALPSDVALPQLRRILEISKLNLLASARYVPQPYPKRITLFRSAELRREDVGKKEFEIYNDPALGWGAFAVEPVDIHVIPGDHFTLLAEPNVRILSEHLKACLDATQAAHVSG
jgi:thioesterase domain-containing protein